MNTLAYFSHHKCATTYISGVLRNIALLLGMRVHTEFLGSRLPLGYEKDPLQAQRIRIALHRLTDGGYDLLCHGNADNAVVAAVEKHGPFRGFHVVRDPRDMIVSGYFWHRSEHSIGQDPTNLWNTERRQRLLAAGNDEEGLLMELDFSESYMWAMETWNYQQSHILEMRYEDMIIDPFAFFQRAFNFIGLPIASQTEFTDLGARLNYFTRKKFKKTFVKLSRIPYAYFEEILQEHSFQRQSGGRSVGVAMPGHKYRKGIANDWRNHFTPRVTAAFQERYGHMLDHLGYEQN